MKEFGDVGLQKKNLLASIQVLDGFEEIRPSTPEETVSRAQYKTQFEIVLLLEEINWRQKSQAI